MWRPNVICVRRCTWPGPSSARCGSERGCLTWWKCGIDMRYIHSRYPSASICVSCTTMHGNLHAWSQYLQVVQYHQGPFVQVTLLWRRLWRKRRASGMDGFLCSLVRGVSGDSSMVKIGISLNVPSFSYWFEDSIYRSRLRVSLPSSQNAWRCGTPGSKHTRWDPSR